MQSVIMAGGFGTRLQPLTYQRPKPMVPVAGVPMMEHIVRLLVKYGFDDAISLLYYHGNLINDYFGDGAPWNIRINYKSAQSDLGTAGSVRNASDLINSSFIVISADVLTDFDLKKAIEFHKDREALATIVLTRHPTPLQFGIVILDEDRRITRFLEKPAWGQVFSDTINTGIYILEPEILEMIPKGELFDFSMNLFPKILSSGKGLFGYIADGYWRDVGNLREYRRANEDALWERVKLHFPGKSVKADDAEVWIDDGVEYEDSVKFEGRVLLGKGVKIYSNAYISNSVLGENTVVYPSANIEKSVIWENVEIGSGAYISDSTIASQVKIDRDVTIQEHSVIADGCSIGKSAIISAGVKLWPGKTVEDKAVVTESLIFTDRVGGELFADSRISGVINWEISPEFTSRVGAALGASISKSANIIVVSRDADRASQITARSLSCGVMSAGIDVEDLGLVPIPLVRQQLMRNPRNAGVHIRKSPHDNKMQDMIFLSGDGTDLPTKTCRKIEQLLMRENIPRAEYTDLGRLSRPQGLREWYRQKVFEHIDKSIISERKFKIVIDYEFGAAAQVLPPIIERFDAEVVELNAYVNPNHLTKTRDEREAAFKQLSKIVRTLGATMGFAIDPTAERITLIDELGNIYRDNQLLYIICKLYLSQNMPKSIAVPISATMGVNVIAREHGVNVIRTRNDHLSMMEAAHNGIEFVGGTRGGFIFQEFGFACDGMFAVMKTLELLANDGRLLSEIAESMPNFVRLESEVHCPWHAKGRVMRSLIEKSEELPREIIDGVRIIKSDSWVLILPDVERPVFHLLAEGKTGDSASQLLVKYEEMIKELCK